MSFLEDEDMDVLINFEGRLPTDTETTENDDFFTNDFFSNILTKNGHSGKPKMVNKSEASESTTKKLCVDVLEKSPRQERRNARERGRKARLNAAFQVLRSMVPKTEELSHERKLTQVEILRLAKNYISYLTSMLQAYGDDVRDGDEDRF